jgi:O-antigen/teichoic acid export membrane protein
MLGWGVALIIVSQLNPSSELLPVLAILAIGNIVSLSISPIQSAFQGMERMHYNLWDAIFEKGLFTLLAVTFALLNFGLILIALSGLIAGIPAIIFSYWRYLHYSKFDFKLKWQDFKNLIKGGMPFFVLEATLQIYMWMGVLILSIMTNEATVAFYHTPTRLFGTLLFIPVIVGNAMLPALCRMAKEDPDNQIIMTRKALSFFIALSFPMAIGTTTLAEPIILTLYGKDFEKAIPVLVFLSWSVIPTYMGIGIVQSLIAQDRQAKWAKVNGTATLFNLLLNIGLIQVTQNLYNNGAIGTAITLVITEIGITTVGFRLLTKGTLNLDFFMLVLKTLMATAIMLVAIVPLRDLFFIIPIIVGALVYGLAAIVLGIIPPQYLKMALSLPRQLRSSISA